MRNLSDTITRLAAFRTMKQGAGDSSSPSRLNTLLGFGSNPGDLVAKIYVPEGLASGASLVVVLHGCTQTAAGYDAGAGWTHMAEQQGFAVLFPEQQRANNPNLCFNWFVSDDCRRDSGEALSIRQMIGTALSRYSLDADRVFINGLSAGGAMTSMMLATYPEVFAGGAIIAGLPYGVATSIPEAFDRMRGHGMPLEIELQRVVRDASDHAGRWPTISVWHGADDRTVAPTNADAIVGQWRGVHGLDAVPSSIERSANCSKRIWTNPDGRAVIEEYRISGMGHGTPIDSAAAQGRAGPFMLDVGISSTRTLCETWGLNEPAVGAATQAWPLRPPLHTADASSGLKSQTAERGPASPDGAVSKTSEVRRTIESALRAAGLMR